MQIEDACITASHGKHTMTSFSVLLCTQITSHCAVFFFPFCPAAKLSCTLPPSPPLGCCLVRCVCTLWDLDPTVCGCLCNWCDASQRQPSDSAPYLRRRFQQSVCSLPVCDTLSCLNTQLQVQGTRRLHNQIFAANI